MDRENKRIKYCSILLLVIFTVGCLTGILYIMTNTLMHYHIDYIGISSTDIQNFNPKLHNLILVFLKLIGTFMFLINAVSIVIALIPFRRAERWAWLTLFLLGLIFYVTDIIATFYVGAAFRWGVLVLAALFLVAMLVPVRDFFGSRRL